MNKRILLFFVISGMVAVLTSARSSPTQDGLKASIERGKKVYDNICLACHQANGSGVPGMNPPLKRTKWVLGDKKTLINVVLKGLDQEIVVNDETFANTMPSFAVLSDKEIADVLTYVRNNFGNKASRIMETDVKKVRGK